MTREAAAAKTAAEAEAERMKRNGDAQALAAQTEAARLKQANDEKMLLARNEAAGLRADNDAQRAAAQAELARVGSEKDRLEREKVALRAQLLLQFNAILQTRDTARGLIVNMSDVLFDTGKFTLRPEAREKLARVAGIVEGHPGLKLAVEGYTDSVGTDDYNQTAFGTARRRGARRPDHAGDGRRLSHLDGIWQDHAGSFKRYCGWTAAKPAGGVSDFRRCHWHGNRRTARGEVIRVYRRTECWVRLRAEAASVPCGRSLGPF